MKSLKNYIQEKLIIKKNKSADYKYFPKSKKELKEIIKNAQNMKEMKLI